MRGITKESVQQCSYRQLMQSCIHDFTMENVATELGISKRTLYKMYRSKNDAIRQCLSIWIEKQSQLISDMESFDSDASGINAFNRLILASNLFADETCKLGKELLSELYYNHEWSGFYINFIDLWSNGITHLVYQCVEGGSIKFHDEYHKLVDKMIAFSVLGHICNTPKKADNDEAEDLKKFYTTLFRGIMQPEAIAQLHSA